MFLCGLDAAVDVVGGKWKALILWALEQKPHRFGELLPVEEITERIVMTREESKPMSARCSTRNVRMKSDAPTSSTSDNATSATTSALRIRFFLALPNDPRPGRSAGR